MGYPKEILAQSRREISQRHEQAVASLAARRAEVSKKAPRALLLEQEIASTSARLSQALLSGENITAKIEEIRIFNQTAQQNLKNELINANIAPNALELKPYCSLCEDTGFFQDRTCECLRLLQRRLMYERLGVSASVDCCGFDCFDLKFYSSTPEENGMEPYKVMCRTLQTLQRYAKEFSTSSSSLLLCGGPGLGKTHLSLSIGYEVISLGFDVLYIPFHSLLNRLEAARFGKGEDEYRDYIYPALETELLILDDLGSEFLTSFVTSSLYELVNSRLIAGLPTVISTNLTQAEVISRYGERIYSRLYGSYKVIPFVGEDVRIQKAFLG